MKKQFFRIKQLTDQTFYRAEKSEALTDELQDAEKHVERIRNALNGLNKRLGKPSESGTQDPAHKEKRLKKCPEYVLGQTMIENAGEEGLMYHTLTECGKAQIALANEAIEHEGKVESYVLVPLQKIMEKEVPNILKYKKNLQRLVLDMDSIRTRYQQASKHNTGAATKLDSLKDELEEAETKVEQCRDQLAAEMFQLMSKETELAQTIFQYVKLQRAYHESALHSLQQLIPGVESYINDNQTKPVYKLSLEEHLRVTNRKIALPIGLCVCALLRVGINEEGLFRIASGASKLKRMKLSFDACWISLQTALEYKDPHVIAGALKSYLRELPEPLLTYRLYPNWMAAAKIAHSGERLNAIWEVLHQLPTANYDNLRFLIKFFEHLTKNQEKNKMTPHNIAIVVAPNLIWNSQEDTTTVVMDTANNSSLIVEQMITFAHWFFKDDVDFDYEADLGIVNGSEQTPTVGMRRCVSNNSLSDHGESPTQGSPKPATRRKNKPAPTPPSGNTPDKHFTQAHHENRRPDDKPPPAPDKPPRPLTTSTLNRATYKSQKHDQVTAELVQLQNQDNGGNSKAMHLNKLAIAGNRGAENDAKPMGFEVVDKAEILKDDQSPTDASQQLENSPSYKNDNHRRDSVEERMNASLIGFEALSLKASTGTGDVMNKSISESMMMMDNAEKPDSPKLKPVPADKPSQSTLERRKVPVAAPRNINVTSNQQEDSVEMRRKPEGNSVALVDRNSKPAIPERPAGLARPSSLIRPHPRHSNEHLDSDSGPLTLERIHTYSVDKQQVNIIQLAGAAMESNGTINLQRSPSVGSRPVSMSLSHGSMMQPPDKPPRPELLPEPVRSHSRTRSEGNIIDVQTQTNTVIVPKSQQQQQVPPASPRFHQRPPRPQPPPPPPPTGAKPKSEHESTNL